MATTTETVTVVPLADLLPGDVVRGWDDGDPYRATVKSVTPRPVLTVTSGPLQWVYDVAYEGGHIAYSQDGTSPRKVTNRSTREG